MQRTGIHLCTPAGVPQIVTFVTGTDVLLSTLQAYRVMAPMLPAAIQGLAAWDPQHLAFISNFPASPAAPLALRPLRSSPGIASWVREASLVARAARGCRCAADQIWTLANSAPCCRPVWAPTRRHARLRRTCSTRQGTCRMHCTTAARSWQQRRPAKLGTLSCAPQHKHARGQIVHLLRVALEDSVDPAIRQVAAISFKNTAKRDWEGEGAEEGGLGGLVILKVGQEGPRQGTAAKRRVARRVAAGGRGQCGAMRKADL